MPRFWIVDVFTDRKYSGNQLAVVADDGSLSAAVMQEIACEMHFSETTFVVEEPIDGSHGTRIFTPEQELPFAGHPTLGTSWVIREEFFGGSITETSVSVPAGRVPVSFDASGIAWMTPPRPELGPMHERSAIARAVSLRPSDLDEFPVQTMKSPFAQLFVPVRTLAAIERARLDVAVLEGLHRQGIPSSVYLFTRETRSPRAQAHARLFAPALGVPEDPATGSAAGCFAAYAAEYGYLENDPLEATIEQGLEMGRPSELFVRAVRNNEGLRVSVGGRAVIVASGTLR